METVDRYRMYKRGSSGVYFQFDKHTKSQLSLHTKDRGAAVRMIRAANEKELTPMINRQIGMIYLSSTDPDAATRTWGEVVIAYSKPIIVQLMLPPTVPVIHQDFKNGLLH